MLPLLVSEGDQATGSSLKVPWTDTRSETEGGIGARMRHHMRDENGALRTATPKTGR
jgi:hypothetical protein